MSEFCSFSFIKKSFKILGITTFQILLGKPSFKKPSAIWDDTFPFSDFKDSFIYLSSIFPILCLKPPQISFKERYRYFYTKIRYPKMNYQPNYYTQKYYPEVRELKYRYYCLPYLCFYFPIFPGNSFFE